MEIYAENVFAFYDRTIKHIKLVSDNLLTLKEYALTLGISERELEDRRIYHDRSKFLPEEFMEYVIMFVKQQTKQNNQHICESENLLWCPELKRYECKECFLQYSEDETAKIGRIKPCIEGAIKHHYLVNRHHPEHFENTNDMTPLDILEMVSDWDAMSQELGGSTKEWADKNIGTRWQFNLGKLRIIGKTIDILHQKRMSLR